MIGAIGDQAAAYARPSAADAGKRGDAVGQQAKAAVSAAREAGADLPKNAQGIAASGIARGADPASIFAALVTPVTTVDPGGEVGGVTSSPTDDGLGAGPVGSDTTPVEATPSAPLAPPPPNVADTPDDAPDEDAGEVVQVAVSNSALSVDDGEVALELLTASQAN